MSAILLALWRARPAPLSGLPFRITSPKLKIKSPFWVHGPTSVDSEQGQLLCSGVHSAPWQNAQDCENVSSTFPLSPGDPIVLAAGRLRANWPPQSQSQRIHPHGSLPRASTARYLQPGMSLRNSATSSQSIYCVRSCSHRAACINFPLSWKPCSFYCSDPGSPVPARGNPDLCSGSSEKNLSSASDFSAQLQAARRNTSPRNPRARISESLGKNSLSRSETTVNRCVLASTKAIILLPAEISGATGRTHHRINFRQGMECRTTNVS